MFKENTRYTAVEVTGGYNMFPALGDTCKTIELAQLNNAPKAEKSIQDYVLKHSYELELLDSLRLPEEATPPSENW